MQRFVSDPQRSDPERSDSQRSDYQTCEWTRKLVRDKNNREIMWGINCTHVTRERDTPHKDKSKITERLSENMRD